MCICVCARVHACARMCACVRDCGGCIHAQGPLIVPRNGIATVIQVPIQAKLIDVSLLDDGELAHLNEYHQLVLEKVCEWGGGGCVCKLQRAWWPCGSIINSGKQKEENYK